MQAESHSVESLTKTLHTFINMLPIVIGMLLATSLAITLFPEEIASKVFGIGEFLDAILGATIGSIATGNPLASYLLGGELLGSGIGLIAVTALLVSWVTVGIAQLPAEALLLGARFALYRNLVCFMTATLAAFLTVYSLQILGMA